MTTNSFSPSEPSAGTATDMEYEKALAVIQAKREAEQEERNAETARKCLGKYFKYRNRYSDGEEWWLYKHVTNVTAWGACEGLEVQHTSRDTIEIETKGTSWVDRGGWTEISPSEFWKAVGEIAETLNTLLHPTHV